ncbi:hypothetical protein [Actinomadura sp. WMMA1423]|uniref:hypothetical protein n=1 Tax=Actinomadura sp. WMMA1423 TaxID=2591108 RepID=UPI00143D329C|nr:hypothetical protein [Actinomadura sp. WMMA1423]
MAVTTNDDVYAINKLTGFLLPELRGPGRPPVTAGEAAEALAHLADAAHRKHMAGPLGGEVLAAWASNPPSAGRAG